ncbi:metal-dependent hydrolase [Paenibacillaceae bacterium WGS1546]|uniref:metal-dependent hydrolase n=1 Tax=Cohnella sp. WGS1546 TaxID=3366810 RepID=UPI00372D2C07
MKGKTHLGIGLAIGGVACLYYPAGMDHAALYLSVAGLSALSADLDGPSILSGKISKLSKLLRQLALWTGLALAAGLAYLHFAMDRFDSGYAACAIAALLIGFVAKQGAVRNALVSAVGGGLLAYGARTGQSWLVGFGAFVVVAPWLKHRGLTHSLWALIAWGAIGRGLENELGIPGIAAVATAGYASHLLADTLTPSGVKWLYPLYKKAIRIR